MEINQCARDRMSETLCDMQNKFERKIESGEERTPLIALESPRRVSLAKRIFTTLMDFLEDAFHFSYALFALIVHRIFFRKTPIDLNFAWVVEAADYDALEGRTPAANDDDKVKMSA